MCVNVAMTFLSLSRFSFIFVTLPPTTPRPKVTNIGVTTPSKTSVSIYTFKSTKKLTNTPTTITASTATKLTTNVLKTTPRTSTTATTAKTTITTKLKAPSTRKLISTPTTETFSTALQMTTSTTEAKAYDITTIRPTLASNHLSGTFILRSSTLPVLQQESTTTTMSTKIPSTTTRRISLSKKTTALKINLTTKTKTTSTSTTSTIYTTIAPSTKLTITPSFITTIASKPSLTSSILTREIPNTEAKRKTTLLTTQLAAMSQSKTSMFTKLSNNIPTNTDEFKVYMIIGTCIFGAFLIVIGVIIVKRYRSSASKERISQIEPTGTDGLVNPSTKKAPDNAYPPMPLGSLGSVFPSNVDENVKAVYVECPDNVYDISRIHRPHVLQQNNIYQTNESIYNTTFAKKDYDINNDSNPYQSCVEQHPIKRKKD